MDGGGSMIHEFFYFVGVVTVVFLLLLGLYSVAVGLAKGVVDDDGS